MSSVFESKSLYICLSSEKQAHRRKRSQRVQQVTEERDESEEEATDNEDPFFKIEEDSSVKTPGKQFNPKIIFSDLKESYFTKLRRQLNIGATYNVMGSVTWQSRPNGRLPSQK